MKTINLGKRQLFYYDVGSGFPVILLHGARSPEDAWDHLMPVLAAHGFRVIYPYRAGRGGSTPHEGGLTLSKDRRDVLELMSALQIEKAVYIGHSQGAFVAQQLYLAAPEKCAAVICVDSMAFGKFADREMRLERFDEETMRLYEKNKGKLQDIDKEWEYPSDFNVARCTFNVEGRKNNPEQWEAEQQKPDSDDIDTPTGKYCHVPLLVFAAGRGRFRQQDKESAELQKSLPSEEAVLIVVTESGHSIQREQPEKFNAGVLDFLQNLPAVQNDL